MAVKKEEKLVEEVSINSLKPSKSKSYIIPLLYKFIKLPRHNIVNSFIRHEDHPDKLNHIFIVFKWSPAIGDTMLEDEMIRNEYCVFHVDLDKTHYMICFRIPDEIQGEYDKFLSGKYSMLKEDSKKSIIAYYGVKEDHVLSKVLRQDPKYREQLAESLGVKVSTIGELSDIVNIEKETYSSSLIPVNHSPLKPMRRY